MNISLLGAPFSGKGTLARNLEREFGFVQISTGDLFRENIKKKTKVGVEAKKYIDKGQLVPDDITIEMLKERLLKNDCKKGVIFDGFPRTINQAKALEKIVKIDVVIKLDVPFEIIKRRCLGRRICSKCGATYGTETYPYSTCTKCNAPLIQRDDDNLETLHNRLEVYEKQTTPLINFYADRLFSVDSSTTAEAVLEPVKNFLEGKKK